MANSDRCSAAWGRWSNSWPHGLLKRAYGWNWAPRCGDLRRTQTGWQVHTATLDNTETEFPCQQLMLATSASAAARLLSRHDDRAAAALGGIPSTRLAVVSVAVHEADLARPLTAFGLVVPRRERRPLIAASFASVKFAGRAPAGQQLIRVFVGGAMQPDLVELDDGQLERLVADQLQQLLGIRAARVLDICRWTDNSPQYHLGHAERVAQLRGVCADLGHLHIAGNSLAGVGIPQCIRSGLAAADEAAQARRECD